MKKEFNDTGLCVPKKHYMIDTSQQLKETIELIERGKYFIINRPRQFGKTTTINCLTNYLREQDDYLPIDISFEGKGSDMFKNEEIFTSSFLRILSRNFYLKKIGVSKIIEKYNKDISTFENLSDAIVNIISHFNKKVVLFIDEVDKSSNNHIFIEFLGFLRDKYLDASKENDITFHSVVLAGLHDVKNLKLKLRPDEQETYNSPWNIAISYDVDMTFSAKQIETMLVDYVKNDDSSPKMDIAEIAEKLYYHTSGYPYFVSKLCKIIDEKIKPVEWTEIDILQAIKILLAEKHNSNFDKVINILEENNKIFKLTQRILLGCEQMPYDFRSSLINLGSMHGIFLSNENNYVKIFNRIYDEMITSYISVTNQAEGHGIDVVQSQFLKSNGNLDIDLVLTKFKDAIEEKYSKSDLMKSKEFLENDLRMKFFMFLKPVLNGIGFIYKEVQISEEKRLDAIILFNNEKFIIELKLWKGDKLHKQGINQIKDYMMREKVDKGYMIIMNKNQSKEYKTTNEDGVFTAWV